jgi:hypothetical protein
MEHLLNGALEECSHPEFLVTNQNRVTEQHIAMTKFHVRHRSIGDGPQPLPIMMKPNIFTNIVIEQHMISSQIIHTAQIAHL